MFTCSTQGSVDVISGTDPLTNEHIAEAAAAIERCFGKRQPKIVFNLQAIPLVDSTGLELLLDLRDRCLQQGGALQLAEANPLCRDILQVTEVAREFAMFDDVISAVGSFSQ